MSQVPIELSPPPPLRENGGGGGDCSIDHHLETTWEFCIIETR